mmetsp:Transcript_27438/g.42850  ORF Transcript_27438/g.42850 Transcript_27438/m.42850 type:complete len:86 (+) Transcript_27438:1040-1297(+)
MWGGAQRKMDPTGLREPGGSGFGVEVPPVRNEVDEAIFRLSAGAKGEGPKAEKQVDKLLNSLAPDENLGGGGWYPDLQLNNYFEF